MLLIRVDFLLCLQTKVSLMSSRLVGLVFCLVNVLRRAACTETGQLGLSLMSVVAVYPSIKKQISIQ